VSGVISIKSSACLAIFYLNYRIQVERLLVIRITLVVVDLVASKPAYDVEITCELRHTTQRHVIMIEACTVRLHLPDADHFFIGQMTQPWRVHTAVAVPSIDRFPIADADGRYGTSCFL
jgi:hypothetical protein